MASLALADLSCAETGGGVHRRWMVSRRYWLKLDMPRISSSDSVMRGNNFCR